MAKTVTEGRRPRGYLTMDLDSICKQVVTGEVVMQEGTFLTPFVAAKLFGELEGCEKDDLPSSGAVANIFRRWETIGYATFRVNPFAFVDFTERGRELGLDQITEEYNQAKKALSAAEKADELEAIAADLTRQAEEAAAALASEMD